MSTQTVPMKRKAGEGDYPVYAAPHSGLPETYFDRVPAHARSDPFSYELAPNGPRPDDDDAEYTAANKPSGSAKANGTGKGKDADKERTSRACLACRKLKTRCDGADDPPCRRCRSGGHECIFVESKRGKRPAKSV